MKEIFIHVGAGKTGTTAVQEFLKLNQSRLANQGLELPVIGRRKSSRLVLHDALAGGGKRAGGDRAALDLWRQIAKTDAEKVLVTSERFHSRVKSKKGESLFREVSQILKDFNIRIIFYIRREEDWLESAYEQWIKSGNKRDGESLQAFIKSPRMSLGRQIYRFSDVFGHESIIVRPYEPMQFVGGSIFSDFLNVLQVSNDDEFVFPGRRSNPRLLPDALEFKRNLNSVSASKEEAQLLVALLKEYSHLMGHAPVAGNGSPTRIDESDVREIRAGNADLYSRIAREFLGRSDGRLFYERGQSDCADDLPEAEDTSRVCAFLILRLYQRIRALEHQLSQR